MNFIDTLSQALFGGLTPGGASGAPSAMPLPSLLGGPAQKTPMVADALSSILGSGVPNTLPPPRPQMPVGGNGMADALGAILRQSGAVPKPQSPSPSMMPTEPERLPWQSGQQPVGAPAPAAAPQSAGITGKDVASFLRSVMTGAANVDPSRPGISAFAQGASGSMNAKDALTEREKATALAAEDRSMKLDDRAFGRAKDIRGEARADSKDKRDGRLNELKMLEATAKVMRDIDPTLDVKDKIAVERLVRDEGKRIMADESLSGEELKTRMETYRKDVEGRLKSNKPSLTGGGAAPSAAPKAATASGDGKSAASPLAPQSKADFDGLPAGAFFVNPADGRVLQKK